MPARVRRLLRPRAWGPVLGGLLLGLTLAGPLRAQVSRADSAAVLLESARVFEARDRWDIAEALYQFLLERYPETAAALSARERLSTAPVSRRSTGRTELVVWTTLYGLWLGTAIPTIFDADGPEPYGLGLLLGGPAGFLAGRSLARSRPLSSGQARAITLGGSWGTWQGAGWANVAELNDGSDVVAAAVAGGLVGIAAGTLLSRKTISDGLATTVNFGALWSTWFGFALGYIAGIEDDGLLATTLLAGDAGLLVTSLLGPHWDLSRNRARLISIAGVIGGLGGAGIDLLTQPDDDKVALAIPLATSIGGLIIGVATTRDRDRSNGADGPLDSDGALIQVNGRRWDVGLPTVVPWSRTSARAGGPVALYVPLLRARF